MITNKNVIKLANNFLEGKEKHLFTEWDRISNNEKAKNVVKKIIRNNSYKIYTLLISCKDEDKVKEFLTKDSLISGAILCVWIDNKCAAYKVKKNPARKRLVLNIGQIKKACEVSKRVTYTRLVFINFLADETNSILLLKEFQDDFFDSLLEESKDTLDFGSIFQENTIIMLFGFKFITKENKQKLFNALVEDIAKVTNQFGSYNLYNQNDFMKTINKTGLLDNIDDDTKEIFRESVDENDYELFNLDGLNQTGVEVYIKKFDFEAFDVIFNALKISHFNNSEMQEDGSSYYKKILKFSKKYDVDMKRVFTKFKITYPNSKGIDDLIRRFSPDLYENLCLM